MRLLLILCALAFAGCGSGGPDDDVAVQIASLRWSADIVGVDFTDAGAPERVAFDQDFTPTPGARTAYWVSDFAGPNQLYSATLEVPSPRLVSQPTVLDSPLSVIEDAMHFDCLQDALGPFCLTPAGPHPILDSAPVDAIGRSSAVHVGVIPLHQYELR